MFWWLVFGGIVATFYFMVQPVEESNTNIDAFFINSDVTGGPDTSKKADNGIYHPTYTQEGRQVLVLYGTEYGFAEDLAKRTFDAITKLFPSLQLQPRLVNMKDHAGIDWSKEKVVLVLCSTTGDGAPPTDASDFFEWIGMGTNQNLSHISYTLLALGDSNYPHFCKAGKSLDAALEKSGAKRLVTRRDVDQEEWDVINQWMDASMSQLVALAPNIPIDMDYWVPVEESTVVITPRTDMGDLVDLDGHNRNRPFMAEMTLKTTLTTTECDKDKEVIHVDFDLTDSGITYTPGDCLGIYPVNNPEQVQWIIGALHADSDQLVDVPTGPCKDFVTTNDQGKATLFDVLTYCYDLRFVRPDLITAIGNALPNGEMRDHCMELLFKGISSKTNSALAQFLKDREIIDVIEALCGHHSISPDSILPQFRPLLPRYYSISSAPSIVGSKVSVTVDIVRYSLRNRTRTGVCSTQLSERMSTGMRMPVFVVPNKHFCLPSNPSTPIIMIGPGTGVAPFLSFLQERTGTIIDPMDSRQNDVTDGLLQATTNGVLSHVASDNDVGSDLSTTSLNGESGLPTNVLFFGCRHRDHDFIYRHQLTRLDREGKVKLITAFSRETEKKIYVQHRIKEHATMVWALLQKGGHLYVCGDATYMAADVHEALLAIIQSEARMGEEEAATYLDMLEREGRYQKDVWA